MNNKRRQRLLNIIALLRNINEQLTDVSYDEQDSLDNIPENLLESERCVKMEENIDAINDAMEYINSAIELIQEATCI